MLSSFQRFFNRIPSIIQHSNDVALACSLTKKSNLSLIETRIALNESERTIKKLFYGEQIFLPPIIFRELLDFLSKACTYEEEETKIRPRIVVGSNLLNNSVIKLLQATPIPFVIDEISETHIAKRLKSMLPFCNNGWRVFIDFNYANNKVQYGIVRNFNGPCGLRIDDVLSSLTNDEKKTLNLRFVLIDVVSNFEIKLKTTEAICTIDYRLLKSEEAMESKRLFCADLLSAYEDDITRATTAYDKVIDLFSQKLHGCICLIIQHDYELPDNILQDGIFLQDPIDIYSILSNDLNDKKQNQDVSFIISSHEKFHAFTGVLIEMLNIDGITIVDNKGRIRAFNVFVKPETVDTSALSGGARRRAAQYLCSIKNSNYIGVYFQSQDGMSSYERINR